ncbi:MAG: Tad domain-containing protein [Candidatus Gastranaerophilales bacterium]|nr:Tad domain-containing protein [Candidatus Gastranaerophilales bacterium]
MKKRQGNSLVVFVFGVTAILALASLVVDIGILINCQDELQKAVESAALVGASELEPQQSSGNVFIDSSTIENVMTETFNKMIQENSLINNINPIFNPDNDIKITSKAIRIAATAHVNTYFTGFIGFNGFTVTAKAAAISVPAYLSSKFPTPDGSIDDTNTNLRTPIGGNTSQSFNGTNWEYDNIYGYPDNKAISLGPGGYITIKLPAPLVDNIGADLFIKELGNLKGYFVFAGNDDPDTPGEIKWVNISCTGIPTGTKQNDRVGAYYTDTIINSVRQAKFYGSGYFDLGMKCIDPSGGTTYDGASTTADNIKNAKYLRIIDDNVEDGYMADDPSQPVILAGDHSSVTPGVNIDAIAVLHHTMLIDYADLDEDSESGGGDGLIDILEKIIGIDQLPLPADCTGNCTATDFDGDEIDDITEYIGRWYDNSDNIMTNIMTSGASASKIIMTSPRNAMTGTSNKDSQGLGIINVK